MPRLPIETLGLSADGLPSARLVTTSSPRKRAAHPPVHAGAYKRRRTGASVSNGNGSYVRACEMGGGVLDEYSWGGAGSPFAGPSGGSGYTGRTSGRRVGIAALKGPTASDLSVLLGNGGTGADVVVDGTENGGREEGGEEGGEEEEGCVECPHCSRRLRNAVTLQNHVRVVHEHCGSFRCGQCGLSFMWRSTLGNHVRLVHEKQRPYGCEECGKGFRWKSHLREHFWVVHKGEKPFKCGTCGKAFGRKNNMQKHVRKHGTDGGGVGGGTKGSGAGPAGGTA